MEPDSVEVSLAGNRTLLERRIFTTGGSREMVYFGGLVGGTPLPYRLDHEYSVASKRAEGVSEGPLMAATRMRNPRFWGRLWRSFSTHRAVLGAKQFVRVSASVDGRSLEETDKVLKSFLETWLRSVGYREGLTALQNQKE